MGRHRFPLRAVMVASLVCAMGAARCDVVVEMPAFVGQVEAKECRVRDGIGHVMAKIKAGKAIRIAYFGGSITAMDGWRRLSREWLQTQYPGVTFTEIAASIGGTGSGLGVFRFGQDVLQYKPDLVFVEFASNDGGEPVNSIWRNFDGIVRQTWLNDPETDIVFAYTVTQAMLADYTKGLCPIATSAMEQLADYYGIPSICFGPRVTADANADKLVMTIGEAATAVPTETPNEDAAIIAELAKQGKVLFSKDGVHPVLEGARAYYLESFKAAWLELAEGGTADHTAKLAVAFADKTMEAAKMVPITPEMLSGTWQQVEAKEENGSFASRFGDKPWMTQTPGSKLKFRFRGCQCQIYDLFGPATGQLWVSVDGKRGASPVRRFDAHSSYYRLGTMSVFSGADGVHDVEIELDSAQPSRAAVPESALDPEKYNGTKWFPGCILLVGDVCTVASSAGNRGFWFDAHVADYVKWPSDASFAEGGAWNADGATLDEAASVDQEGALSVGDDISFVATAGRSSTGTKAVSITTDVEFEVCEANKHPEVRANDKGGLLVIVGNGETNFYGIAKIGTKNGLVKLDGPVVDVSRPATVKISFWKEGGVDVVGYSVNGADYAYKGRKEIPVLINGDIGKVDCRGGGVVYSLSAVLEKLTRGIVFFVR